MTAVRPLPRRPRPDPRSVGSKLVMNSLFQQDSQRCALRLLSVLSHIN